MSQIYYHTDELGTEGKDEQVTPEPRLVFSKNKSKNQGKVATPPPL